MCFTSVVCVVDLAVVRAVVSSFVGVTVNIVVCGVAVVVRLVERSEVFTVVGNVVVLPEVCSVVGSGVVFCVVNIDVFAVVSIVVGFEVKMVVSC